MSSCVCDRFRMDDVVSCDGGHANDLSQQAAFEGCLAVSTQFVGTGVSQVIR
jgi:hypothetical protein